MKRFFLLLFSFSLTSLAMGMPDCKVEKKTHGLFANCQNRSGYLQPEERLGFVTIQYKQGTETESIVLENVSASDITSASKTSSFLSSKGIANATDIKVTKLSVDEKTPLYKDPETQILASGCHFTFAPTVISYGQGEACGDFICNAEVECKNGKKTNKSDAICRGSVEKGGVLCPTAYNCLNDTSVTIENYVHFSGSGSSTKPGRSGGVKQ